MVTGLGNLTQVGCRRALPARTLLDSSSTSHGLRRVAAGQLLR